MTDISVTVTQVTVGYNDDIPIYYCGTIEFTDGDNFVFTEQNIAHLLCNYRLPNVPGIKKVLFEENNGLFRWRDGIAQKIQTVLNYSHIKCLLHKNWNLSSASAMQQALKLITLLQQVL